jgi:hypothetical protein
VHELAVTKEALAIAEKIFHIRIIHQRYRIKPYLSRCFALTLWVCKPDLTVAIRCEGFYLFRLVFPYDK